MALELRHWDKEVAPHLHEIEWAAGQIDLYTSRVLSACYALCLRPEFETTARDSLKRSITFLEITLAGLQKAAAVYDSKPVDK